MLRYTEAMIFDDPDAPRDVPLWLPLSCFALAALLYLLSQTVPAWQILQDVWWTTVPVGLISLMVKLRSRNS